MATSSLSACGSQDGTVLNANASQKTVTENEKSTQETSDYISDIILDAEESTDIEFSKNVSDEESSEAENEKVYTKADVDGDGEITADDYILLKRAIFGMTDFNDEQKIAGDLNNSGKLDPTDYIWLKRVYFGTAKLEDILNGKPVEDESSEDVSEETSSEIIESSEVESVPDESSEVNSTPIESAPAESEIESSDNVQESSEEESSKPIEDSSEDEPVISTIPSVPSEDEPIENDPIEESSEDESSEPTDSETNESKYNVDAAENLELTEERIVYYINQYRIKEGKCEMTMLTGKSRAFARGRSVQLTTNFAHDVDAMRELATELEYGRYVPPFPESYYDFEKDEVVYTGEMTEPYYQYVGGEAIGALINAAGTADQIASAFVDALYESKAHWEYIGHEDNNRIAIGVQTDEHGYWTCCALSLDAESAELYD